MRISVPVTIVALLALSAQTGAEQVTLQPVQDAFVCDCMPNTTNPMLGAQYLAEGRYSNCHNRSFVQWDLSSIPAGSTIESAQLELWCCAFYGSVSGQLAYYFLTEAWNEGTVTYNNMPSFTTTGAYLTSDWPAANSWHVVDMTGFVTGWFEGSFENFGLYCHSSGCTGTSDCAFYSNNVGNPTYRPHLVITYTPPAALEPASWAEVKTGAD